jgi:hypothetical protein
MPERNAGNPFAATATTVTGVPVVTPNGLGGDNGQSQFNSQPHQQPHQQRGAAAAAAAVSFSALPSLPPAVQTFGGGGGVHAAYTNPHGGGGGGHAQSMNGRHASFVGGASFHQNQNQNQHPSNHDECCEDDCCCPCCSPAVGCCGCPPWWGLYKLTPVA